MKLFADFAEAEAEGRVVRSAPLKRTPRAERPGSLELVGAAERRTRWGKEPRLMKTSLPDGIRVMRGRYACRWGWLAGGALLDEHCQSTGLERKYANKVLRGQRRTGRSGAGREARRRYGLAGSRGVGAAEQWAQFVEVFHQVIEIQHEDGRRAVGSGQFPNPRRPVPDEHDPLRLAKAPPPGFVAQQGRKARHRLELAHVAGGLMVPQRLARRVGYGLRGDAPQFDRAGLGGAVAAFIPTYNHHGPSKNSATNPPSKPAFLSKPPCSSPCPCSRKRREDHRDTMNTEKNKGQRRVQEVTNQ